MQALCQQIGATMCIVVLVLAHLTPLQNLLFCDGRQSVLVKTCHLFCNTSNVKENTQLSQKYNLNKDICQLIFCTTF